MGSSLHSTKPGSGKTGTMKDQRWGYPAKGSYLYIKKHRKPWWFSGEPMSVLRVPGHSEENE